MVDRAFAFGQSYAPNDSVSVLGRVAGAVVIFDMSLTYGDRTVYMRLLIGGLYSFAKIICTAAVSFIPFHPNPAHCGGGANLVRYSTAFAKVCLGAEDKRKQMSEKRSLRSAINCERSNPNCACIGQDSSGTDSDLTAIARIQKCNRASRLVLLNLWPKCRKVACAAKRWMPEDCHHGLEPLDITHGGPYT